VGNQDEPAFLRYLFYPDAPEGLVGAGNIHHIAVSVETEQGQSRILRRLTEAGIRSSGIVDRLWFRSLYFRDPDGNLLEVATKGPGYAADESPAQLGTRLALPPWLEPRRSEIESKLAEQDQANPSQWPPSFDLAPIPVERL
jgi:glyoxalase family protein